ncbi:MAG: UbiA prenyltransferase family protein, partial [Candidatus Woesearchaeota archaeon]
VFLPLIFVGKMFELPLFWVSLLGFVSLCLCSSFNYIINDVVDRKKDRAHPEKRKRPIAAGRIGVFSALLWSVFLLVPGLWLAYSLNILFFYSVVFVVVLTQFYSFLLKRIAFADIIAVAINFVVRAVAGAFLIKVTISPWLVLCTFFFALFLLAGKRYADLAFLGSKAAVHKETLRVYTKEIANALMIIATALLVVAYGAFALLGTHPQLAFSLPFALFVIFRYFSLIYSGSPIARHPELVFKDVKMMIGMLLWAVVTFIALYVYPR